VGHAFQYPAVDRALGSALAGLLRIHRFHAIPSYGKSGGSTTTKIRYLGGSALDGELIINDRLPVRVESDVCGNLSADAHAGLP
jgi:hypothetical protein